MKKLMTLITLAAVAVVMGAPMASAAVVSTSPIVTRAEIDGVLSLSVLLKRNSSTGPMVTSMDFGKLIELTPTTGTLRSSPTSTTGTGSIVAMVSANSHGLPYTITTRGTALTSGANSIPAGACTFVPVYSNQENSGLSKPSGAVIGSASSWVSATDKAIYTSESGVAAMRTIQTHYSITDDPAAGATSGVPLNQPGGTYTGTVTITVTA